MDRQVLEEDRKVAPVGADAILTIQGLRKSWPKFTLGPVNLAVPRGSLFGLIGPNGAGKTTLLHCIMGMAREDAGRALVEGLDHRAQEAEAKALIGFSGPVLNWRAWKRVDRVVAFLRPFYPDWDDAYCAHLLERFRIDPSDRTASLSYGARTKLSLAMALAHRPLLLLLDEPTAGLDAAARRVLFEELLEAVESGERTAVLSSHDLSDLERYTDRVGILHKGIMMAEGAPAELCEQYRRLRFTAPPGWQAPRGAKVFGRRDGRLDILIEIDRTDELAAAGLPVDDAVPVNLEDLFLGLTEGEGREP